MPRNIKRTFVMLISFMLFIQPYAPSYCDGNAGKTAETQVQMYGDIILLIQEGRYYDAEKSCREKLQLNRNDYIAMTHLGEIYWETGKRRPAIGLFRKAIKTAPGYPPPYFFLGKAYLLEKKTEKALKEFAKYKERMKLMPPMDEFSIAYYTSRLNYINYIYTTMKRYKEAISGYKEVLAIDPKNPSAAFNLAVCYYVYEHNISKTYGQLQKVIEIDPNSRLADRAKYYIDYLRRNPDERFVSDFTFIEEG